MVTTNIIRSFGCFAIFLVLAGCKSPSERIMDEFKNVDSSLQGVNAVIEDKNSLMQLNLSILANQKATPCLR